MITDHSQLEAKLFACLGKLNGFIYKELSALRLGKDFSSQKLNQLNRIITVIDAIPLSMPSSSQPSNSTEPALKKAGSPFHLFVHDFKATQIDGENISYLELSKRASLHWKQANAEVKRVYQMKAEQILFESVEKSVFENIHLLFSEDAPSTEYFGSMEQLSSPPACSPNIEFSDGKGDEEQFESSVEPDELQPATAPLITPIVTPESATPKKKSKPKKMPIEDKETNQKSSCFMTPMSSAAAPTEPHEFCTPSKGPTAELIAADKVIEQAQPVPQVALKPTVPKKIKPATPITNGSQEFSAVQSNQSNPPSNTSSIAPDTPKQPTIQLASNGDVVNSPVLTISDSPSVDLVAKKKHKRKQRPVATEDDSLPQQPVVAQQALSLSAPTDDVLKEKPKKKKKVAPPPTTLE